MVEICGVKYIEGKSKKTGNPYAAYIVMFTEDGARQGFDGYVCGDAFVDISLLNGRKPRPGDKIELNYNKDGYLTGVVFV